MCTCGKPATLRTLYTRRNLGRSFFGCLNYNTKGLPYCNYFKWADSSEDREKELLKKEIQILRKEEELRKREEEIVKMELGVHNDQLDIQSQHTDIRCERRLLRIYLAICILVCSYVILSR
ncbi:hypothetical protein CIPAW_15G141100 [Carya illinoinensis]|nr:hypothetical protein CIPAW_15G141100 [Carya illinoinensis]